MMSEKIFLGSMNYILIKTTNSFIILINVQNSSRMARNQTKHSVWTQIESEQLIQWLENPENLRKIKTMMGSFEKDNYL